MSGRTVPQSRHYCKYCNSWMGNNKISIANHEAGVRHKQNVENHMREQQQQKRKEAMEARDLSKTLREIEQAAREKVADDLQLFASTGGRAPPPPPPRRPSTAGAGGLFGDKAPGAPEEEETPEEDEAEALQPKGQYAVRGRVYLEGTAYDKLLFTGLRCQVFLETVERWADCMISAVKVAAVPGTDIVLRRFDIMCFDGSTDADVLADRIRISAPPPPGVALPDADANAAADAASVEPAAATATVDAPAADPHPFGAWTTVAVRVINEEEEAERERVQAAATAAAAAEAEAAAAAAEDARERAMPVEALEGDDALSTFNPWGGSTYRGVQLADEEPVEEAEQAAAVAESNAAVSFKKRRVSKQRSFRRKEGE